MSDEKTQEEEEEEDDEESSESTEDKSVQDKKDEKTDNVEEGAKETVEEAPVQEATEERPAEEPVDAETLAKYKKAREKEIHMFLVMTVHRVLSETGTLSCLNEVVTAAHIKRLVELTLDKFSLAEEISLQLDKHRLVARAVTKELKKTFVGKVRCMLLLPDPSVEYVIAACIQKHTEKVLTEPPKTFWKRLLSSMFS